MTNINTTDSSPETVLHFRACDPYYHANMKGNGSAIKFELHPAHDTTQGSIFVTLAMQKTIASVQGGKQIFPTFDWKNAIKLKLDRTDLSAILQVLRGVQESINEGKGLFHRSTTGTSLIKFSHQIEPRTSYTFSVWKKLPTGEQQNAYFIFDASEAFVLMLSLEQAMIYVCFGIPEVIARSGAPSASQRTERLVPVPIPMPVSPAHEEYAAVADAPF